MPSESGRALVDGLEMPAKPSGLRGWFAVWNPRYRAQLLELGVFATLAGLLAYAENVSLAAFSKSLAPAHVAPAAASLLGRLTAWSAAHHLLLPVVMLAIYVGFRLARIAVDVSNGFVRASLLHRSRSELEGEILDQLLRKDDGFFTSRPPAEILNRLSSDITRVIERRTLTAQRRQSVLLILGNVYFFFREDWRLALAGVLVCGAGAYTMDRLTRPVKEMDRLYMARDDRVKSTFEDLLRAAPEIQVANLAAPVRARLEGVQLDRRTVFLRYQRLNSRMSVASSLSYLLALVTLCLIPVYGSGPAGAALVLVPVVIKALPDLFANASQLVYQRLNLTLAETSCARLAEYESEAPDATDSQGSDAPGEPALRADAGLVVADATFRYRTPEGSLQGGIAGVSTTFPRSCWTSIVGGAGSGKSTLLQLVVGRTRPQSGEISFGEAPYAALSARARAQVISLMPQTPAMLDASIEKNVLFGLGTVTEVSDADLEVVEATGLGVICRTKALTMLPVEGPETPLRARVVELRARVREALAAASLSVEPFEGGARDPQQWVIEALLAGRSDRAKLLDVLTASSARPRLQALAESRPGAALVAGARRVIEGSRALLDLPSYPQFAKLAPFPCDERVWQLRTAALGALGTQRADTAAGRRERVELVLVALTSSLAELGALPAGTESEAEAEGAVAGLRQALAGLDAACVAFDPARVHPHLTWRENLVFGRVAASNARADARIDQTVLEVLARASLEPAITRVGLAYAVGRGGGRLSGGQRQLLGLTRALLRRTPVLVLDEPTSALDPKSRKRVCEVLRAWKQDRIVVTVSHDPEFVRESDAVRVMEAGRLVASGSFAELERDSEAFRNILKVG